MSDPLQYTSGSNLVFIILLKKIVNFSINFVIFVANFAKQIQYTIIIS